MEDERFEENAQSHKLLISEQSNRLPEVEPIIASFLQQQCSKAFELFRKKFYKQAFKRYKHLEDLMYLVVRAMTRLARKLEDDQQLPETSYSYISKVLKAYSAETLRSLKSVIKKPEGDQLEVDVEALFRCRELEPDELQAERIEQSPTLLDCIAWTAHIYNQKGLIAFTKEKFRLGLQNFVKGIGARSQLLLTAEHRTARFVLLVNAAFALYKMDSLDHAVLFCDKGLNCGEEVLKLVVESDKAALDCFQALNALTFAPLFLKGADANERKQPGSQLEKVAETHQVKVMMWRRLSEGYFLLAEVLASSKKRSE